MKATIIRVSNNKSQITNPNGYSIPALISRAWNFSEITEDIFLEDQSGNTIPFIIIPLVKGNLVVGLVDDPGTPFTISEAETEAFIGSPMMYLVSRIYSTGTTVISLNIGI